MRRRLKPANQRAGAGERKKAKTTIRDGSSPEVPASTKLKTHTRSAPSTLWQCHSGHVQKTASPPPHRRRPELRKTPNPHVHVQSHLFGHQTGEVFWQNENFETCPRLRLSSCRWSRKGPASQQQKPRAPVLRARAHAAAWFPTPAPPTVALSAGRSQRDSSVTHSVRTCACTGDSSGGLF